MSQIAPLIELRNLPGVERITALCRNDRNFEYPQSGETLREIDEVCIRLFGITNYYLEWVDDESDDQTEKREWKLNFQVVDLPWPEARLFWESIGWDVSDGNGNELISAHWFMRPIIAAVKELDEDAKLTLDGSGVWKSENEIDLDALTTSLEAQAQEFLARRR